MNSPDSSHLTRSKLIKFTGHSSGGNIANNFLSAVRKQRSKSSGYMSLLIYHPGLEDQFKKWKYPLIFYDIYSVKF